MSTNTEIRRLRGRIAEEQVTHTELARLVEISTSKFSRILHGHQEPPDGFVERTEEAIETVMLARAEAELSYERAMARGQR